MSGREHSPAGIDPDIGHDLPSEMPTGSGPHYEVARALAALMTVACIGWNLDLPALLGFAFIEESFQATVLGLGLAIVFLTFTVARRETKQLAWYDGLLAIVALALLVYVGANFLRLKETGYSNSTNEVILLGAIITALVLECLRRSSGYVLLAIVGVFLLYAPLAHIVPGPLVGLKLPAWQIVMNLGFNPNAIFGLPLVVSTTIVIMFILLGQVLFKAGGGEFFTDLAMAAMGRRRGGAAKISVVASALFGTISGTAVSNVVTTGIITIPLMRKAGYSGTQAGAIEAIASTGGQFMPPIMGAAAFLMAEFLEIPYAQIMLAALIPALLYYFAAFVQVDLIAARDNISFVDQDIPKLSTVLISGWYFTLPFVVLIYLLFWQSQQPAVAAIYSTGALAVVGLFASYRGRRIKLVDIYEVLAETGLVVTGLLMIVAASGMVIGVLNMTGLGLALPNTLVEIAGNNLWAVLLISATICIILGMGMPTTAVYILLAALVAPAIIHAGIEPVPAHMFILYFGMMSMITPPIALAAFAAATLTKADPMATGFEAMKLGWVAYVVPFLFVLSPTLLLYGEPWMVALNTITATVGVYLITVAVVGYFVRPLGWVTRSALTAAGFAAMVPDSLFGFGGTIDLVGVAGGVALLLWESVLKRRTNFASSPGG
jgi:TRAP transporter 4TM/12TM fusion protein